MVFKIYKGLVCKFLPERMIDDDSIKTSFIVPYGTMNEVKNEII